MGTSITVQYIISKQGNDVWFDIIKKLKYLDKHKSDIYFTLSAIRDKFINPDEETVNHLIDQ